MPTTKITICGIARERYQAPFWVRRMAKADRHGDHAREKIVPVKFAMSIASDRFSIPAMGNDAKASTGAANHVIRLSQRENDHRQIIKKSFPISGICWSTTFRRWQTPPISMTLPAIVVAVKEIYASRSGQLIKSSLRQSRRTYLPGT